MKNQSEIRIKNKSPMRKVSIKLRPDKYTQLRLILQQVMIIKIQFVYSTLCFLDRVTLSFII